MKTERQKYNPVFQVCGDDYTDLPGILSAIRLWREDLAQHLHPAVTQSLPNAAHGECHGGHTVHVSAYGMQT